VTGLSKKIIFYFLFSKEKIHSTAYTVDLLVGFAAKGIGR